MTRIGNSNFIKKMIQKIICKIYLDSGSVSDGLIGVDTLGGFFSVEVFFDKLLNLRDTGGSSDQDDVVDAIFVDSGITERFFDGVKGSAEKIRAELLESSTGD